MADGRLTGRVVLVTGAARGIGAACARACAAAGARVIVSDILEDAGRATADSIAGARYEPLDVREEADWSRAIAALRAPGHEGRLDVLVNNAGITGFPEGLGAGDPEHASLAAWRAVHATNLDGSFLGCRAAIGAMRPPAGAGGVIINIGSRSGRIGVPAAAAYASSKAAVESLTKSVALYCAEQQWPLRCNAILPGAIRTPMWESMVADLPDDAAREAALAGFAADVPLGRMGQPEDVASMVVHLASDEAAYVTGAAVAVDGGLTAGTARPPARD